MASEKEESTDSQKEEEKAKPSGFKCYMVS